MRWCPTPNSWCPCPSNILSPPLWSHQRKNPIGQLIDKEKKKTAYPRSTRPGRLLHQWGRRPWWRPGDTCTWTESSWWAEPQLVHQLLPEENTHKKNDFLLGWKYKSRCSLSEWGRDWTYCTQSADVSSWWIMFSHGAVVVCMFRSPGEVYP